MLTKLLPDQISQFWDIIKYAIEQSLPPIVGDHPDKMNRILTAAISGRIDCWASYVRSEEINKFEGIVLTKVIYDDASDTRNLLIYCVYGYESVQNDSWLSGIKSLVKYAKGKGCNQIIAYSELPHIVDILSKLGADTKFTFISFNVNETVEKLNSL